jgi:hypothetical protein
MPGENRRPRSSVGREECNDIAVGYGHTSGYHSGHGSLKAFTLHALLGSRRPYAGGRMGRSKGHADASTSPANARAQTAPRPPTLLATRSTSLTMSAQLMNDRNHFRAAMPARNPLCGMCCTMQPGERGGRGMLGSGWGTGRPTGPILRRSQAGRCCAPGPPVPRGGLVFSLLSARADDCRMVEMPQLCAA